MQRRAGGLGNLVKFACLAGLMTQEEALERQLEEFCLEPLLSEAASAEVRALATHPSGSHQAALALCAAC